MVGSSGHWIIENGWRFLIADDPMAWNYPTKMPIDAPPARPALVLDIEIDLGGGAVFQDLCSIQLHVE